MGGESKEYWAEMRQQANIEKAQRNDRRKKVADKVAKKLETEIINIIIRPGPTPEERECTTVAQEIKDYHGILVSKILHLIPDRL